MKTTPKLMLNGPNDDYQLIIGSNGGEQEHWCERHSKPQHLTRDPYKWEIYNEEVMLWLCDDCEQERADDI